MAIDMQATFEMWWEKLINLRNKFCRETYLIGYEREDLEQECYFIFLEACAQYDEEMEVSFPSYYKVKLYGWRANMNRKIKRNGLAEGIDIMKCEDKPVANPAVNVNRAYPVSGGVIRSILAEEEEKDPYHKIYVDGIDACIELLESMEKGELEHCFVEVNICQGGCIKGPASKNWKSSFVKAKIRVEEQVKHTPADEAICVEDILLAKKFTDRSKKQNLPSEADIKEILKRIGKTKKEDELNCGGCGYPTCRAKATAVYQGKAEVDMCLPYAVARAESMSNVVMDETPNLVLIVNRELRICECNRLAQKFLGVNRKEALESYIFEYISNQYIF